jgi:hypothetical protein
MTALTATTATIQCAAGASRVRFACQTDSAIPRARQRRKALCLRHDGRVSKAFCCLREPDTDADYQCPTVGPAAAGL